MHQSRNMRCVLRCKRYDTLLRPSVAYSFIQVYSSWTPVCGQSLNCRHRYEDDWRQLSRPIQDSSDCSFFLVDHPTVKMVDDIDSPEAAAMLKAELPREVEALGLLKSVSNKTLCLLAWEIVSQRARAVYGGLRKLNVCTV